ncbi:hypothetical protein, partial [Streptomyces sp. SID3343]|uniref:hypothetical protein n=1 Tax=Streptomyces sp. SID3343 TaxID=2690260 RepID=UPI0013699BF9
MFSFAHDGTAGPALRRRLGGRQRKSCTLHLRSVGIGLAPGAVAASPMLMSLVLADLEWCIREERLRAACPPWWRPLRRLRGRAGLDADRDRLRALAATVVREVC